MDNVSVVYVPFETHTGHTPLADAPTMTLPVTLVRDFGSSDQIEPAPPLTISTSDSSGASASPMQTPFEIPSPVSATEYDPTTIKTASNVLNDPTAIQPASNVLNDQPESSGIPPALRARNKKRQGSRQLPKNTIQSPSTDK
jgi:hypothetical protein